MFIKPMKEIYLEEDDITSANEKRINIIRNNIENKVFMEETFKNLKLSLEKETKAETLKILKFKLFLEEINLNLITVIHRVFNLSNNKEDLIEELKKSYKNKGVKGIVFSWTPVLRKY